MLLWTGLHSDPNGFHFRRVKCCLELHALERQRCSVLWDAAKQKLDATSEALKVLEKSLQAAHGNPDENFEKYLTSEERGRHDKSKALASTAYSDLKEATAAKDETVDIAALFWDFASLPQKDAHGNCRTKEETEIFAAALSVMLGLYASARVVVLRHSSMPPAAPELNTRPYFERGWCLAESHTALAAQVYKKVIAVEKAVAIAGTTGRIAETYETAIARVTPVDMAKVLSRATFTGKGDDHTVLSLYADVYNSGEQYDEAHRLLMV
mmetsp:Transcript_12799/g.37565  ORF Transcript_12799/g.37565 Transcript_12799/m.37565 type:complete len:268 (-) Transcript_12799:612-1415(-)